jgi:integrase
MDMPKITKRTVDATTPADKPFFVWDDEIKGFGLQVFPSGVKSFVYQYRNPEGTSRRGSLGKHSEAWTAEQARKKAKKWRRIVEDGGDPVGEDQAKRKSRTVTELLDQYLESEKFRSKAESTQSIDKGRIKRHLKPTLGKIFVHKLTAESVRRAFAKIRDGKTAANVKTGPRGRAIVTGGEGTARMAIRLFKAVMVWAIDEGMATDNPAQSVKTGTDKTRDVILEKADDYKSLFRTLDKMENEKRLRPAVADAIRVIALTGARRGEIAGLQWSYVDLKNGVLVLPPSAHKTGKATGQPRIIGLPAAAQAIIAKQTEGEPEGFVFPPSKGEGQISLSKPWREIRTEAKLPEGIGLHGLRHSLASSMAMNGAQAAEIMTALGHRQLSTAQKYIHWAQDERAALAEKSSAHIAGALADSKKAEVEPIKKGGRQ